MANNHIEERPDARTANSVATNDLSPDFRQALNSARLKLAERFLDEVILVHIQAGKLTQAEAIVPLYKTFQKENAGLGDDFSLVHTLNAVWQREVVNQCHAAKTPESLPESAAHIEAAIALLEQVAFYPIP